MQGYVCGFKDADALLLITEWPEFKEVDPERVKDLMRQAVVFDGRNFLDGEKYSTLEFEFYGVGRWI